LEVRIGATLPNITSSEMRHIDAVRQCGFLMGISDSSQFSKVSFMEYLLKSHLGLSGRGPDAGNAGQSRANSLTFGINGQER
jgi:hypothetical protein